MSDFRSVIRFPAYDERGAASVGWTTTEELTREDIADVLEQLGYELTDDRWDARTVVAPVGECPVDSDDVPS